MVCNKMKLYKGDCLEVMKTIQDKSIDAIITDPPYGTTACKWDSVIDFELMWEQLNRIIKPNGAIVLFGSEPFSSALRMSNIKDYKYDWIWNKKLGGNSMLVKHQPSKIHENILIFRNSNFTEFSKYIKYKRINLGYSKKDIDLKLGLSTAYSWWEGRKKGIQLPSKKQYILLKKILKLDNRFDELILKQRYIPQMTTGEFRVKNGKTKNKDNAFGVDGAEYIKNNAYYPKSILEISNAKRTGRVHPTQKPVPLMEYLIKTYTNENETVLDFTMGSGSTGVACKNTNRNFIGIEQDQKYFNIAEQRIKETEYKLF